MVNQRVPHQGSESELEDVIANIASEARALEAAQTTGNMNDVPIARMAPLGLPRIEHAPTVAQPNPLPRADVNTFDNFEFPEDGDDEAGDWRPDVPEEVHVRGGEAPQPQRPTRGRRSRSKPIPQLPEPNELAEYGWEDKKSTMGVARGTQICTD